MTGEGGREASVVAERKEDGRRAELVPKPQKRPNEGVEEGRWRAWVSAKTHHNHPQPAKRGREAPNDDDDGGGDSVSRAKS